MAYYKQYNPARITLAGFIFIDDLGLDEPD